MSWWDLLKPRQPLWAHETKATCWHRKVLGRWVLSEVSEPLTTSVEQLTLRLLVIWGNKFIALYKPFLFKFSIFAAVGTLRNDAEDAQITLTPLKCWSETYPFPLPSSHPGQRPHASSRNSLQYKNCSNSHHYNAHSRCFLLSVYHPAQNRLIIFP